MILPRHDKVMDEVVGVAVVKLENSQCRLHLRNHCSLGGGVPAARASNDHSPFTGVYVSRTEIPGFFP